MVGEGTLFLVLNSSKVDSHGVCTEFLLIYLMVCGGRRLGFSLGGRPSAAETRGSAAEGLPPREKPKIILAIGPIGQLGEHSSR